MVASLRPGGSCDRDGEAQTLRMTQVLLSRALPALLIGAVATGVASAVGRVIGVLVT